MTSRSVSRYCTIPMPDGVQLAAKLWLPEHADARALPTVLEYHPYRLHDGLVEVDENTFPWFAEHGYAAVRVDIRGTGESGGLMEDEYTEQELTDGLEILKWIARQPWSNGKVGMVGISWSGFNALQIAALNPPELKAIAPVAFSDDRFADDIHYMGGCLLTQNFGWSMAMTALNSRPPDPAVFGEAWRDAWLERLDDHHPFIDAWLCHQTRDAYWKRASVCEAYQDIRVPVCGYGGWVDPYTNTVMRLARNLSVPARSVIGPWAHQFPHIATPEPSIGFLHDLKTWFDRWLHDDEAKTSADDREFILWMQRGAPKPVQARSVQGQWLKFVSDPECETTKCTFSLSGAELTKAGEPNPALAPILVSTRDAGGTNAGFWCPKGSVAELPEDQAFDDARSRTFTGAPFDEEFVICGTSELTLSFTCDRPSAHLCARLCEVDPDGRSYRVSFGLLNLGEEMARDPDGWKKGKTYRARLTLNDACHAFPKGSRLRLSLSTNYWPMIWPSPEHGTVQLDPQDTQLVLPHLETPERFAVDTPFPPPEKLAFKTEMLSGPARTEVMVRPKIDNGRETIEYRYDSGLDRLPCGLERHETMSEIYRYRPQDPLATVMSVLWTTMRRRDGWECRTTVNGTMTGTKTKFVLEIGVTAYENDQAVFEKATQLEIPRNRL